MTPTESAGRGLRAVLFATAVAGVVGYIIQLLAPALLTSGSAYVAFSVFWSTLYLGGAAISGVQQEVSRATHPHEGGGGGRRLLAFAATGVVIVAIAGVVVAFTLGDAIIPDATALLTTALTVGFVGYLATSVLTGVFYGLHLWRAVAFGVIADALIRAVLVVTGLLLGWNVSVLAVLIAIPFGIAVVLSWAIFGRRVVGSFTLDVGLRRLFGHAASTVIAASASGVMISGLPMFIGLTSSSADAAATGALLLAVTVTRAPIVIPIIALQSFLISAVFRGDGPSAGRLVRLVGIVIAGGMALSAIGWFVGPPVLELISGGQFTLSGSMAATIVFSAALVAGMCLTGPALIAVRHHTANVVGWVVAAAMTILLLFLPQSEMRVALALTVAPALGLLVHLSVLLWWRRAEGRALDPIPVPTVS